MNLLLRLPAWSLTTAAVLTALWLTLAPHPLPDDMDVPLFEGIDKVVHALMMAGVAVAAALDSMRRSRNGSWERLRPRAYVIIMVAVTAFGGAIELAQMAMHMGRGAEWADFAADAAGAAAATIILPMIPWPRSRQTPERSQTGRGPQSHRRD